MKAKALLLILTTAIFLFTGTVNAKPSSGQYGPVKEGETLWDIAYKSRPKNVSRLKMMRAIHQRNSLSFRNNNINMLKEGSVLEIPTTAREVTQFIRGAAPVSGLSEKGKEELEQVRSELADVIKELNQSRSTLKGLKDRSSVLTDGEKNELKDLSDKYESSQEKIAELIEENKKIKSSASVSASTNDNDKELQEKIDAMSAQLKESQDKIATLEKEKSTLAEKETNSADTEKLASTTKELEQTRTQLDELKVQNDLLKEQAASVDAQGKNNSSDNKKVSETIAALNSDIGELRKQIKELEELEVLKDKHIVQLQKQLDHATVVIKNQAVANQKQAVENQKQAEVTKKLLARLDAMDGKAGAVVADVVTPSAPEVSDINVMAAVPSTSLAPIETKQAGVVPISDSIKNVTPKFWLLLTLAGLLFVLALLWRSLSGRNDDNIEEDMEDVDDLLIKR